MNDTYHFYIEIRNSNTLSFPPKTGIVLAKQYCRITQNHNRKDGKKKKKLPSKGPLIGKPAFAVLTDRYYNALQVLPLLCKNCYSLGTVAVQDPVSLWCGHVRYKLTELFLA